MNKRGQSIIEYALIATLVILGVVFMGPYVLRSVNAHFKLWDTGIRDSFEENLKQAPVNALPAIPITCTCTPDSPGDCCGSPQAGSPCAANQRIMYHSCNPQGCDQQPASWYKIDDSCCTTYSPTPNCGKTPIRQTPPSSDCNVGQRIWATACSDLPVECRDDSTCSKCTGTVDLTTATSCPNGPSPTGFVDITYVAQQTDCDSTKACQYYCNAGDSLNAAGTACSPNTVFTLHVQQYLNCQPCSPMCYITSVGPNVNETFSQQFNYGNACGTQYVSGISYGTCTQDPTDLAWKCGSCMQETLVSSGPTCPNGVKSVVSVSIQAGSLISGRCGASPQPGQEDDTYTVICNP